MKSDEAFLQRSKYVLFNMNNPLKFEVVLTRLFSSEGAFKNDVKQSGGRGKAFCDNRAQGLRHNDRGGGAQHFLKIYMTSFKNSSFFLCFIKRLGKDS